MLAQLSIPGQTGGQTEGAIYAYRFHSGNGMLTPLGLAAETNTPGFFTIRPSGQFLHTVNEVGNYQGKKSGGVSAFAIDQRTGHLRFLNTVLSGDPYPTYVTTDATGTHILVSNYFGGVAVFPVSNDGRLLDASSYVREAGPGSGVNPERQEAPHPHSIELSSDNRFAIAVDLGLDKLLVYRFDQTKGALTPNDPAFAIVKLRGLGRGILPFRRTRDSSTRSMNCNLRFPYFPTMRLPDACAPCKPSRRSPRIFTTGTQAQR